LEQVSEPLEVQILKIELERQVVALWSRMEQKLDRLLELQKLDRLLEQKLGRLLEQKLDHLLELRKLVGLLEPRQLERLLEPRKLDRLLAVLLDRLLELRKLDRSGVRLEPRSWLKLMQFQPVHGRCQPTNQPVIPLDDCCFLGRFPC
jgi:hypothetical protein